MLVWLMPAYIISGVALVIAGYQSYLNKPFCFQNQAIRNAAIPLHRIKVRQFDLGSTEQLTPKDEKQYEIFKRADKKYLFIDKMLNLFVAIHLVCLAILIIPPLEWGNTMPLYYISGLLILVGKPILIRVSDFRKPLCVTNQSFYELDIIESFYKKINHLVLSEEEERHIENYETEIKWNRWQMNILYFGISLHVIASILHGIVRIFHP